MQITGGKDKMDKIDSYLRRRIKRSVEQQNPPKNGRTRLLRAARDESLRKRPLSRSADLVDYEENIFSTLPSWGICHILQTSAIGFHKLV
jgi:hypothetical protein